MRKMFVVLGLIVMAMFVVSCAPTGEAFYKPQKSDLTLKKVVPSTTQKELPPLLGCRDSDFDSETKGINPAVPGVVTNTHMVYGQEVVYGTDANGNPQLIPGGDKVVVDKSYDFCSPAGNVQEKYCDGSTVKNKDIPCSDVESCQYKDQDEGYCAPRCRLYFDNKGTYETVFKPKTKENIFVKEGIMGSDYGVNVDTCVNNKDLKEYWCDGDHYVKSKIISCDPGYKCADGVCQLRRCHDSDFNTGTGKEGNIFTKGNVKEGPTTTYDSCSSDKKSVIETWCDDDTLKYSTIVCPKTSDKFKGECFEGGCLK